MLKYFIEIRIQYGDKVTIECKDQQDYLKKTKFLEENFPNLDWQERSEEAGSNII